MGSYTESSLFRWLEEWLAYSVGYGRVRNWSAMFGSIGFKPGGTAVPPPAGAEPRKPELVK